MLDTGCRSQEVTPAPPMRRDAWSQMWLRGSQLWFQSIWPWVDPDLGDVRAGCAGSAAPGLSVTVCRGH